MENSSYTGLTAAQVKQRQEQGLINETNNNVSKTKKQIILTHTLTYFNFFEYIFRSYCHLFGTD